MCADVMGKCTNVAPIEVTECIPGAFVHCGGREESWSQSAPKLSRTAHNLIGAWMFIAIRSKAADQKEWKHTIIFKTGIYGHSAFLSFSHSAFSF